jgi:hypothetical protein
VQTACMHTAYTQLSRWKEPYGSRAGRLFCLGVRPSDWLWPPEATACLEPDAVVRVVARPSCGIVAASRSQSDLSGRHLLTHFDSSSSG